MGWIGVDLDGTLAKFDEWEGPTKIGSPILKMAKRVKEWLNNGYEVRIITARVSTSNPQKDGAKEAIERWCLENIGTILPVSSEKDYGMIELWDDRCVRVEKNTGEVLSLRNNPNDKQ